MVALPHSLGRKSKRVLAGASVCRPAPLPIPGVFVPRQLVHLEVVSHPRGGWTIAVPIDATQSTARIYRGRWSSRRDAERVMQTEFLSHTNVCIAPQKDG